MEETKHIVILAAGDFPTHPVPLQALREADFVVCCDSAYGTFKDGRLGIGDYVVVGDGDSLSEADKVALGSRWIEVGEQDYNDLHKAMEYATSKFSILNSQFSIVGATGRREDHTIGNISYLITFADEHPGADIEMLTDYGRFVATTGRRTFASFPRQQVSIFTMTPDIPINAIGLKWPLDGFHARLWWQATLNEALGDNFTLDSEGRIIVFQTYDPKQ